MFANTPPPSPQILFFNPHLLEIVAPDISNLTICLSQTIYPSPHQNSTISILNKNKVKRPKYSQKLFCTLFARKMTQQIEILNLK